MARRQVWQLQQVFLLGLQAISKEVSFRMYQLDGLSAERPWSDYLMQIISEILLILEI